LEVLYKTTADDTDLRDAKNQFGVTAGANYLCHPWNPSLEKRSAMLDRLRPKQRVRIPEIMDDPALDAPRHFRALDGLS
jgi:hypothetical protein